MADPRQEAIDIAVKMARMACDQAYETTAPQYRGFITLIRQNKRVGGSREHPWYAPIELPYIRVDGRIMMAEDDHTERGEFFQVSKTEFYEPIPGHWMCRASVTSSYRGTRIGHARVVLEGGQGVDKTNPLENAETSAIGRALGFFGYGLLGSGVASAEEVEGAMREQDASRETGAKEEEAPVAKTLPGRVASHDKGSKLQMRLVELGIPFTHTKSLGDYLLKSDTEEAALDRLRGVDKIPDDIFRVYAGRLGSYFKIEHDVIRQYMQYVFGVIDISDLSGPQQQALIGWLCMAEKDDWAAVLGDLERETGFRIHPDIERWILRKFGTHETRGLADLKKGTAWVVAAVGSDVCRQEIEAYQEGVNA